MKTVTFPPDVTSTLLGGFSPYLHRVSFDFPTNSIEFHLLDRIEEPSCVRVLRFDRLRELEITPHDPSDIEREFIDSIIGAHRDGDAFHFHTDRFAISFRCDSFRNSASIRRLCNEL